MLLYDEQVEMRDAINENIAMFREKLTHLYATCNHHRINSTTRYTEGGYDYKSVSYIVDECGFCGKILREHSVVMGNFQ
jgi:carotenoid cleavage dioxygenase-like enzyme